MYLAKNQQEGARPDSSTRVLNDGKFKSKGLIQEDYSCFAMESLFPYNPLEFRVASSLASGIEPGAHRAVCTRRFRFMHRWSSTAGTLDQVGPWAAAPITLHIREEEVSIRSRSMRWKPRADGSQGFRSLDTSLDLLPREWRDRIHSIPEL